MPASETRADLITQLLAALDRGHYVTLSLLHGNPELISVQASEPPADQPYLQARQVLTRTELTEGQGEVSLGYMIGHASTEVARVRAEQ